MKKTKILCAFLTSSMLIGMQAGCQSSLEKGSSSEGADLEGTVTVDFWSAPQQVQYNFWDQKASDFNATKTEVNGKAIQIKIQQMPESPSSEAGIQNAIVTGTVPALSENISRGFAATLATSGVIYDLQDEEWFAKITSEKKIEETIEGWAIDSKQYVIPEYVNPMVWQWNSKALKALGFTDAPKTVDDFNRVIHAFVDNKDNMSAIGVTHTLYRAAFMRPDQWWERWYDFQMPYMALTGKTSWVENGELTLDRDGTIETMELLGELGNTIQTNELTDIWTAAQPSVLFTINAPWEIQSLRENGKTYGIDGDYVYGPSLVKTAGDSPYNYGDSKGLVLYKNESISDDEHLGAIEFLKWLYGAENCPQTNSDWLKATTMLPVRGDISENAAFVDQMTEYPELKVLAEYVPYSIPSMASDKMTEIQTAFSESTVSPYMQEAMTKEPFNAPDASKYVDAGFEAMKTAGELK